MIDRSKVRVIGLWSSEEREREEREEREEGRETN
jgi:hypothetical protein